MRKRVQQGVLSLHVIAGTYVVLLGFNLPEAECDGLLGFSIHRTDHTENEAYFLEGMKAFAETDPGFPAGSTYSTDDHPIQSFQWADYTAKPGHSYTYTVTARKGTPAALTDFAEVSVTITTESPEGGDQDIYFNRGVAASQAYVRRFGNRAPNLVQNNQAFIWLSRGIYEAMSAFMRPAEPERYTFLIAAYEFHYRPFLDVVRAAANQSDVKIIYDARNDPSGDPEKPSLTDKNRTAVAEAALGDVSRERRANKSYIAHNKFIVRSKDGVPEAVWTGGTNFSEGGIFGHSNVAHVVEDSAVAAKFKDYWMLLAQDPTNSTLKPQVSALTPIPPGKPPAGTTVLFSPRQGLALLQWYADIARGAQAGLFMTFAFGMNDLWKDVYRTAAAPLRFALMEAKTRAMEDGPEKEAEERAIDDLRRLRENVFAIGAFIRTNQFDGWVKERLTGLNSNVRYVHNKFMLVDPLGDEPLVIAGSANFSEASTDQNDENMLIVKGNRRVTDIYLGEFMRLYSHHAFRESLTFANANPDPKPLRTDDWWRDYFGGSARSLRREFFA
jgi:phosphatidylserine/phosphatidylglycerophosphate/cardiolipin synthase-like enzyme